MKKNNLKLTTLFISSLSLGMSILPISQIYAKIPSFLSLEATSNTQNGIADLGNGNASVTIKGNSNQTLIGKKFGVYKLFNAVNSEDSKSINYTLNPEFSPALKLVVAHRLNKNEQAITEYEIIDYIQSLNSNTIEGADTNQILEGRYSEFRYFVEELRNTMKDMNLNPSVVTVNDVKSNNSFDIIGLDYGYYIIDEITPSQNTYQASSLCMVTTANPNATVNIKSDFPSIIKKIQEDDLNSMPNNALKDENGWNDIADFEIGQTVPYKYESFVPNMSGYHTYYFAFHDIMDEALTFNKDSIKIQISNELKTYNLTSNEFVITENDNGDTFKIAIDDLKAIVDREWASDLNNNNESIYGQTITVTYNATLNDKAAEDTGRPGFENDVKLEFSNNPDSDGVGETGETPWDTVVCFTYKINGLKVNNHNVNLKGAKFKLYSDEECTNEVYLKETNNGYNVMNKDSLEENSQTVEMTSNDKGAFTIFGLDQGTYWLKETSAPDGYRQILDPIEITITPTFTNDRDNYIKGDGETDKTLQNLEATAHIKQFLSGLFDDNVLNLDTDLNEGSANITVINTVGSLLPITGSNVTLIMIGTGCILMVGVILSKKEKQILRHKMVKRKKQKLLRLLIFIFGFSLCTYPLIRGLIENRTQKNTISTYELEASALDESNIKSALASANKYNSILYQTYGSSVGDSDKILSDSNYQQQLNLTNNDIMGIIEIPKINVHLPIYHGTNDDVLSRGIGHVKESSLPVGGINTRCLLTGHSGLPTSKLFTRLDELIIGDYFFVKIYNQTNAYQINMIDIIKPEDTNKLKIIPDKDLVSLITCTPYGINTHRLVITGERVEYKTNDINTIHSKFPSLRESIFTILPFLFIVLVIILIKKDRKENE